MTHPTPEVSRYYFRYAVALPYEWAGVERGLLYARPELQVSDCHRELQKLLGSPVEYGVEVDPDIVIPDESVFMVELEDTAAWLRLSVGTAPINSDSVPTESTTEMVGAALINSDSAPTKSSTVFRPPSELYSSEPGPHHITILYRRYSAERDGGAFEAAKGFTYFNPTATVGDLLFVVGRQLVAANADDEPVARIQLYSGTEIIEPEISRQLGTIEALNFEVYHRDYSKNNVKLTMPAGLPEAKLPTSLKPFWIGPPGSRDPDQFRIWRLGYRLVIGDVSQIGYLYVDPRLQFSELEAELRRRACYLWPQAAGHRLVSIEAGGGHYDIQPLEYLSKSRGLILRFEFEPGAETELSFCLRPQPGYTVCYLQLESRGLGSCYVKEGVDPETLLTELKSRYPLRTFCSLGDIEPTPDGYRFQHREMTGQTGPAISGSHFESAHPVPFKILGSYAGQLWLDPGVTPQMLGHLFERPQMFWGIELVELRLSLSSPAADFQILPCHLLPELKLLFRPGPAPIPKILHFDFHYSFGPETSIRVQGDSKFADVKGYLMVSAGLTSAELLAGIQSGQFPLEPAPVGYRVVAISCSESQLLSESLLEHHLGSSLLFQLEPVPQLLTARARICYRPPAYSLEPARLELLSWLPQSAEAAALPVRVKIYCDEELVQIGLWYLPATLHIDELDHNGGSDGLVQTAFEKSELHEGNYGRYIYIFQEFVSDELKEHYRRKCQNGGVSPPHNRDLLCYHSNPKIKLRLRSFAQIRPKRPSAFGVVGAEPEAAKRPTTRTAALHRLVDRLATEGGGAAKLELIRQVTEF